MSLHILKIAVAAILISFVSWFSKKNSALAGFITALPLTTLLALAFSHLEWKDQAQSVSYAKSVFVAIPVSLLFFVPFLLAQKFNLSFWTCYSVGVLLLGVGYFAHQFVLKAF